MSKHYSKDHEWVEISDTLKPVAARHLATIGISRHAEGQLGELVFVELPKIGRTFAAGEESATIESVKAASEVYAPVAGEVVEINEALSDDPGLVNRDAEGEGWLYKLNLSPDFSATTLGDTLMTEAQYNDFIKEDS
ncbi:MAG: glycine cleavage system protein GcvH [Alphaproteobacteria bacterium]